MNEHDWGNTYTSTYFSNQMAATMESYTYRHTWNDDTYDHMIKQKQNIQFHLYGITMYYYVLPSFFIGISLSLAQKCPSPSNEASMAPEADGKRRGIAGFRAPRKDAPCVCGMMGIVRRMINIDKMIRLSWDYGNMPCRVNYCKLW